MSKKKVFIEEMKHFNISVDDIKPSDDLFGAIEKTIIKMQHEYYVDRLEVILNNNLIEAKDKITNFRTILGCRVSYDDLADSISFIVRQDTKPSYEKLEEKINKANELLESILVVSDWEHEGRFRPVKNTIKQDVYKVICQLNELLKTPDRANYNLLGDNNDR